jgi:PhnB protein
MSLNTTPHLNFRGSARAALSFYQSVFGGDLTVVTYKDAHSVTDPAEADQVMWGQSVARSGFRVMAYDVPAARPWDQGKDPFFVSVRSDSTDEIEALWEKLAVGATVIAPLAKSGWAPIYGMLKDKFGVTWVLDVAAPYKP